MGERSNPSGWVLVRVRGTNAKGGRERTVGPNLDRQGHIALRAAIAAIPQGRHELWPGGPRAEDRIGEDVMALLAEIDREKILERTNRGKQQKLAEGKPGGGGKPPYGYRWRGPGE